MEAGPEVICDLPDVTQLDKCQDQTCVLTLNLLFLIKQHY